MNMSPTCGRLWVGTTRLQLRGENCKSMHYNSVPNLDLATTCPMEIRQWPSPPARFAAPSRAEKWSGKYWRKAYSDPEWILACMPKLI